MMKISIIMIMIHIRALSRKLACGMYECKPPPASTSVVSVPVWCDGQLSRPIA